MWTRLARSSYIVNIYKRVGGGVGFSPENYLKMNSQQQQYGRSAVQPAMSAPYWSGPHGQHPSYPAYGAPRMMVPTYSQPSSAPVKTSNREDSVVGSGKGAGTKRYGD